MIIHSPTIVLRRFSYSDTSIIARCFTREMGKISFIIRGAKRKKSPQSAFYEPMSHLDIVFSHNKRRDLHLVTKASFASTYLNIHKDLKRIAYGMAIVELTEKTIIDEDPNVDLFDELIRVLKVIDLQKTQLNLIYWYYQLRILDLQGFKTDLSVNNLSGLSLPDPNQGPNSKHILSTLLSGNIIEDDFIKTIESLQVSLNDRKIISQYINSCLQYHFEGLSELKSLRVLRALVTA